MPKHDIGYILAKLEELHSDIKEIKHEKYHTSKRIGSLEKSRAYIKGVGLSCILILGGGMKYLYSLIQ